MDAKTPWRRWTALTAWLLTSTGQAEPHLHLEFDHLRYGSVTLEDVLASLTRTQGYRLALGSLHLPFAPWRVNRLALACPDGRLQIAVLECGRGQLALHLPHLGQTLSASASFALRSAQGQVQLDPIRFAGGRLRLQADYLGTRWQTKLEAFRQPLKLSWIKPLFPKLSWQDLLKGDARFVLDAGGTATLDRLQLKLSGKNLSFHDPDFARAAKQLEVLLQLQGRKVGDRWTGSLEFETPGGEGLYLPVYLSFQDHPLKLKTRFSWQKLSGELLFQDLHLDQQNVLQAIAEARLDHGVLATLTASLKADLPALFRLYAHPFLEGGKWEGIDVQVGKASGRLTIEHHRKAHAYIHLDRAVLTDRERRVGINRLSASLIWYRHISSPPPVREGVPVSRLSWHAGHLYAIPVGAAELFFHLTGDDFRLLLPADLPVLDGHFFIDQLEMSDLSTTPRVRFRGRLAKISLEVLSRVLGWPPLAGTLSGSIPQVTYDLRQRTLKLDGRLTVEAFDGTVVIEHLMITDLFGVLPRLQADVYFHHLDLEQVTGHFAFGRITGKLEGHIKRLSLENWRPVSFDAWFGTPPGDRTPHRISQKAVENLANLGGGFAADLLSRTLLRLFEEFGYDSLGLGCHLKDEVCELSGLAPAPNGYYIVKGGGLPRIDVIGYNRRIDWPTLTTRLARITQLERLTSPAVQP